VNHLSDFYSNAIRLFPTGIPVCEAPTPPEKLPAKLLLSFQLPASVLWVPARIDSSVDPDTPLDRSDQLRRVITDAILEYGRDFANDARVAHEVAVEHDEIGELAALD
jgi:hypothetical protein